MFRKAEATDIERIAEIQTLAWHAAYASILDKAIMEQYSLDTFVHLWQERFETGHHQVYLYVSDSGSDVVGFCRICEPGSDSKPPANFGELSHLYLDPQKTAKGYGHQLFSFALTTLKVSYKGMLLWTLEHNERARAFYERHGMYTDGVRRDDPEALGEGIYEVRYVLPFES